MSFRSLDLSLFKELFQKAKQNPQGIRFKDLCRTCDYYFGTPRQKGSHRIYKTPWPGDPRVNIQNNNGFAKVYQVKQALKAIQKILEIET